MLLRKVLQRPQAHGQRPRQAGTKPGQPSGNSPAAAQKSNPKIRKPEEIRAEAAKKARESDDRVVRRGIAAASARAVLELPSEHFLPEYELEIEDYFRRLSEDQPDMGRP